MEFSAASPMKTRNRLALDIGSDSLKMLEVSGPADKPKLTAIGFKKIAGFSKAEVSEAIKSLAIESRTSSKEMNISVSGSSVIVRFITMPRMKQEDLKGAVRFEAEKFIPFDIADCITDFYTVKKDDGDNRLSILVVAAKKEYIKERLKLVMDAGFTVNVVDVDSFSLVNAFLANFRSPEPGKSLALINMGVGSTNLSIVRDGAITFVRDVMINTPEAGMPIPRELTDDIKLSFGYYENQSGRSVDGIYVSGEGASLAGMDELFQESFGIKPMLWNPLIFIDTNSPGIDTNIITQMNGSFAIAAGLVLR